MIKFFHRVDEILGRAENTVVVILLSSMILIAFTQIILRNLFSTGISWGDALVRCLVLWTGFIGAAIATREGKHICIDAASVLLSSRGRGVIARIVNAVSFATCLFLAIAAVKFIDYEIQLKNVIFLGIPAWISEIILPVTFGIMAFRYLLHFINGIISIRRR